MGPSTADIERRINRQKEHLERHLEQRKRQAERGQEHVRRHLEHAERHLEHAQRRVERKQEQLEMRMDRKQRQIEQRQAKQRGKERREGTFHEFMERLLAFIGITSLLSLCWVGAFYVSRHGYDWIGWHPHPLAGQLITSGLGMVLWGMVISVISRIPRKKQNDYFQQTIAALRQISRGDFQVDLRNLGLGFRNHPFNVLADIVNEMAANLKNTEEMRQEFISNVSHEIQSPLTSIAGFARVLKQEELNREQSLHYLDIIERESVRLSKLSDNMLRLASLDSKHITLQTERFRLDKQLQQHLLSCEPQWLEKKLEMDADLVPAEIEADQILLSQVWVNLLHNAIKFTPEGGTITVSLAVEDNHALVSVKDTGIGIAEEELVHIFERFYKVDRSRTRTEGGNGLGLSILQKIVELHKGEVSVQSRVGEGTKFTVRLPLKQQLGSA
ncbi:two-component sensor histidine kinase [Paenibacillus physcomitrellae]|uniref:histidine kinase n=2 Tax=Paenibacillus physcomitrellae TaxID=1619311 RepID=A0ABQ1GFG2_9BACL|nr:two-component sensor histidine kinase [Paenibacillus physcomitrellae]